MRLTFNVSTRLGFAVAAALVGLITFGSFSGCAARQNADFPRSIKAYHIGNSLTYGLSLDRLSALFQSRDIAYDYGAQLGGGITLAEHVTGINSWTREPYPPYVKPIKPLRTYVFWAALAGLKTYVREIRKCLNRRHLTLLTGFRRAVFGVVNQTVEAEAKVGSAEASPDVVPHSS